MLKTVVRDDDVDAGMLSKELKPRLHAFAADRHGSKRLARDEERFVSHLSGIGIGRHEADAVFRAPEPARDDAGGPPATGTGRWFATVLRRREALTAW